MFWYASSFNQNIGGWSVENVNEMGQMFCSGLGLRPGHRRLERSTTSGTCSQMFSSASSFNQNIGGWSVEQVTNMHWMFGHASSFNQDIGGWNVERRQRYALDVRLGLRRSTRTSAGASTPT